MLADGLATPTALASDGIDVYWIESRDVRSCAVSGCNNAPTTLYTGMTSLTDIALDQHNVYFTDLGPGAAGDGRVWMLPK